MKATLVLLALIGLAVCATTETDLVSYNPTYWNTNAGLIATKLSYAAYCSTTSIKNWSCQWCRDASVRDMVVKATFSDFLTNTFGYVGHSSSLRTIFVVFRGTEGANLRNWYTNLKYSKTEPWAFYPSVQVHKGFAGSYSKVRNDMRANLAYLMNRFPTYNVVFTGHSLGGALASLAASDMGNLYAKDFRLWTLGSPRVGNGAFVSMTRSNVKTLIRMVNEKDLVTSMPPKSFDFTHLPQEVWWRKGKWKVCSATNGEDGNCNPLLPELSIADHLNYFGIHEECSTESLEEILVREQELEQLFAEEGLLANPELQSGGPVNMEAPVVNM